MSPPAHTICLTRRTQGLTEPHRELIKMLAAKAVDDFLAEETESAATADVSDQQEAQR